jgi:Pyruvate/2-oxoacid:ferredoxin oxidoreductase delta subunit
MSSPEDHLMLQLLTKVIVVDAELDRCEHCWKWLPKDSLEPLASDYTADRAAYDYSLDRDAPLCKGCRCELEAEYGTEKPQSFKHWSYLGY